MADLRKTFQHIQRRYGHNIFLQRKDLASVENGMYRFETNRGFKENLERYTVRMMQPSQNNAQIVQSRQEQAEGVVILVDKIFYFQWDANPKDGDRIYIADDRYLVPGNDQYNGYEMYLIDYAVGHRGIGGRIEYWTVGATRETPN